MTDEDTIAALATAPAPAGIAIIRISGDKSSGFLEKTFRSAKNPLKEPYHLIFGEIISEDAVIDKGLAVFMPGPKSYTGEDLVELQFHGSPFIAGRILERLFALGARHAEAGEFTKRAFLNGKLDLVQAEAIGDVISATSEHALQLAEESLNGKLSSAVEEIGEPLRNMLAEVEAYIDFPEEDIEPEKMEALSLAVSKALRKISALLKSYEYGCLVREGFRVLICGAPNVGKSMLFNRFLGTKRAIVTEISGTTRDILEEEAIFDGYRFVFCDSAGLRESSDKVEKIGIELALERIAWADLLLFVIDATEPFNMEAFEKVKSLGKKLWVLINKVDLKAERVPECTHHLVYEKAAVAEEFTISAANGEGIDELVAGLVSELCARQSETSDANVVITNARHKDCLLKAKDALEGIDGCSLPLEIISAEIRRALIALEEIIGRTFSDEILGRVFARFCIGK